MTPIVMPKLGLTMTEGTVGTWLKSVGAEIHEGEPLVEIETDKVNYSLESPGAGTLLNIEALAGATVPIGQTIAWIGQKDEDTSGLMAQPSVAQTGEESSAPPDMQEENSPEVEEPSPIIAATPLAKKIAHQEQVTLDNIQGRGPNHRIQAADVEDFLLRGQTTRDKISHPDTSHLHNTPGVLPQAEPGQPDATYHEERRAATQFIAHDSMRRAIGSRMSESWTTIPHVTLHRTIDVSGSLALQQEIATRTTRKVSLTAIIAYMIAHVLPRHPLLNAHYASHGSLTFDDVNLGIAVSIGSGLIVPVIHHANDMSILEIAAELVRLTDAANHGTLQPHDIDHGTFTVSNLGMYHIEEFTPIIAPPQTGILGIGALENKLQIVDGQVTDIPVIPVSLSFDHRAVDGVYGAQFINSVAQVLADPLALLI